MVAMDQYGNGQPVQYSLIETNSDWHMAKCMDHFKRANKRWRFVRIVIVDKDMREIDIIRKTFPEARVLLCHFHVIKWLHETIRKSKKYGVYEEDVLSQMKHTITNMTYARTPDAYTSHRDEFKSLAHREDRTELWDYFVKNWDECCEMWVMAYRVGLPHFGNHTNNVRKAETLLKGPPDYACKPQSPTGLPATKGRRVHGQGGDARDVARRFLL
ncbi:hypothetical protein PR001_g32341 [Phytophthora rubi]|uniref:ZSWIM1/3 RNaseH-like domain-containing protein n=1 Tax=Phytophthora rubi TaxID=129364 RepID=A0A6A3GDA5_9STRA|nr:hypothetical protein PR001_g32341 [Phytophthora rubi]